MQKQWFWMLGISWLAIIIDFVSINALGADVYRKGIVIADIAQVYKQSDFDSSVIYAVKKNQVVEITTNIIGQFYGIKVNDKIIGFISDVDVKPIGANQSSKINSAKSKSKAQDEIQKNSQIKEVESEASKNEKAEKSKSLIKNRSLAQGRYRGVAIESVQYSEETMAKTHSENILFYGLKLSGNNTLMAGELYIDGSILFHMGAPSYYEKVTGRTASGWMFFAEFLFENVIPQSKMHILYFGFGPVFKSTHFETSILENSRTTSFVMDDMTFGAVFNLGLGIKIDQKWALRSEVKYYWEKYRYTSLTLGIQNEY